MASLEVVTGDALMVGEGLHAELVHLVHVAQVGIEDARAPTSHVGGHVIGTSGGLFAEFRHALHLQAGFRSDGKVRVEGGIDLIQDALVLCQRGGAPFIRVGIEEAFFLGEFRQFPRRVLDAGVAEFLQDGAHFGFDAGHFLQADLMHLLGGVIGGGLAAQALGVVGFAVGQFPDAVLGGGFLFQFGEVGNELLVGGDTCVQSRFSPLPAMPTFCRVGRCAVSPVFP